MPRLSETFLEELRARNSITDVVSSYVELKRAGRLYKGLCPFHSEKTASFCVYEDTQSYYCFGCHAGGDVITFIRTIDNLDYMDAVRQLAQRAGMQMPVDGGDKKQERVRERTLAINRETARFYYQALGSDEGKAAREYIVKRRLTPETVRHFGLGYAPNDFSLLDHLRDKGFTKEELIASGMKVSKNGYPYDQFHGRLIFPIIDVTGNVIAFGGRKLSDSDNGPKYLNSSDTPVFKKTKGVFALNLAKEALKTDKRIIICEGYMDVIAMHQAGFTNAVAALGTSFTADQARLLSRYADEIILAFDADAAGQTAIARGISLLRELDVKIRVLSIPGAKDPDEYIKEHGAEGFKALLEGASTETDFKLSGIKNKYDLYSSEGRIGYIKECTALIASIENAPEREIYAQKVADISGVSRASVLTEAENIRKRQSRTEKKKAFSRTMTALAGFNDTVNPEKKLDLKAANAEEALIAALIATPELCDSIKEYISPDEFVTAFDRRLYEAVTQSISEYGHFDIGMLGGDFTPQETGKIQGFIMQNGRRAASLEELCEYADIIRRQKNKKSVQSVGEMSDDDFNELIKKIGQNKRTGGNANGNGR